MTQSPKNVSKGFTKAFWVSNTVELFERMAYYAVFIVLTIYLSSILGFNDLEASMISGLFSTSPGGSWATIRTFGGRLWRGAPCIRSWPTGRMPG